MKETNIKKTSLKEFLLRTLADPILWYTVLIMTALMYHYRDREKTDFKCYAFSVGFSIMTFFIGWLVFRVFDFIQKHNFLGFFAYIALALLFGFGVSGMMSIGRLSYPITWGLWFLTPQDSLDFNVWYVWAFYLLFVLFMASVIYYFTRVRYRIFMNFLIFIIPFAIYGKEYEKMPTLYIVLLAVGYVLLMVYYRQLTDNEESVFVGRRRSWKNLAVYAAAFASISALIPKPEIEADRSTLETLISAENFTDKLDAMINVFRDTASSDQFRGGSSYNAVYEATAQEPLRIKTGVCSVYDFETDGWAVNDVDSVYRHADERNGAPLNVGSRMGLADAFIKAAELDKDFAEKYDLEEYVENGLKPPDVKSVLFTTLTWGSDMAPVPQNAISMTYSTSNEKMVRLIGGTVTSNQQSFKAYESFRFDYSDDTFFENADNKAFVEHLAEYDYEELLEDTNAALILPALKNSNDSDDDKDVDEEFEQAFDYFSVDCRNYDKYLDVQLDYGNSPRIKALADEITEGLESEYDKACAIEKYFYDNDFVYDLKYRKKKGDNVETFLFETKTGVCYEYATSMVLLARAAGIPARFCTGYFMTKLDEGSTNHYHVFESDGHAFPELYIKGYGWVSFEPTRTDSVDEEKKDSTATGMLTKAGIIILAGLLLSILFAMLYPWMSHKLFLMRNKKRLPNDTVKAIIHRVCKVYDIDSANTSQEVGKTVYERTGSDLSYTAELFDRSVYGGETLDPLEKEKALNEYIRAYEAFRETRKKNRRTNR